MTLVKNTMKDTLRGYFVSNAVNFLFLLIKQKLQMAKHNIGSLVVLRPGDHQCIAGIVTERGRFFLYVLSTECSKKKQL